MTWTHEPPKEPGWYWVRPNYGRDRRLKVCEVQKDKAFDVWRYRIAGDNWHSNPCMVAWWWPERIEEPEGKP